MIEYVYSTTFESLIKPNYTFLALFILLIALPLSIYSPQISNKIIYSFENTNSIRPVIIGLSSYYTYSGSKYDESNDLLLLKKLAKNTHVLEYDRNGNLTIIYNGHGELITYEYDSYSNGRNLSVEYYSDLVRLTSSNTYSKNVFIKTENLNNSIIEHKKHKLVLKNDPLLYQRRRKRKRRKRKKK